MTRAAIAAVAACAIACRSSERAPLSPASRPAGAAPTTSMPQGDPLRLDGRLGADHLRPGTGAALAWSPDGMRLATGGWSYVLEVVDARTGQRVWELDLGLDQVIESVAWSLDGRRVVAGTRHSRIVIVNAATGAVQTDLDPGTRWITAVAFTADGSRVLALSETGRVGVWSAADGTRERVDDLGGACTSQTEQGAFSADRKILAVGSEHGDVCVWSLDQHKLLQGANTHHLNRVRTIAADRTGGLVVSAGNDRCFGMFVHGKDASQCNVRGVQAAAVAPDGLVAVAVDGRISVGTPADVVTAPPVASDAGDVAAMAFSPDGRRLAVRAGGSLRVLDLDGGPGLDPGEGHRAQVIGVAFLGGERLVSADQDGRLLIWDLRTARAAARLGSGVPIRYFAAAPAAARAATAGWDDPVRVYDLAGGRELASFNHDDRKWVDALAISPDGALVASARVGGALRLWSASGGSWSARVLGELRQANVAMLAFAPDGRSLYQAAGAWSSGGSVTGWDIATLSSSAYFSIPTPAAVLAGGPGAVVIADEHGGLLVRTQTGQERAKWKAGRYTIRGLAFHGEQLLTAGADGHVRLWTTAGEPLADLTGHRGSVNAVAVSPDGRRAASAGDDATVLLYRVGP